MLSFRSLPVPSILAPSMPLPVDSPVSSVYSPAPFLILAFCRSLLSAYESSTYEMAPGVLLTAVATPSDLAAPVPPLAFQALAWSYFHSAWAALLRYLVKLSVVPDSSERCTAVMAVSGSLAPEFCAAIAGSFHLVIWLSKILARVGASSWRLSRP